MLKGFVIMKTFSFSLLLITALFIGGCENMTQKNSNEPVYLLHPIGEVVKENDRTWIVLKEEYQLGLLGLDQFSSVTVIYWFDKNDTPEKRSILQVHPQGNKQKPIRGVFATHSPVRPNLIAISKCKIISVQDKKIEIDDIDAFSGSPVLDLKN